MNTEKLIVLIFSLVIAAVSFWAIYLQGRTQEFKGQADFKDGHGEPSLAPDSHKAHKSVS